MAFNLVTYDVGFLRSEFLPKTRLEILSSKATGDRRSRDERRNLLDPWIINFFCPVGSHQVEKKGQHDKEQEDSYKETSLPIWNFNIEVRYQ